MSTPHQQWEYDWRSCERFALMGILEKMGGEGWELCGVFPIGGLENLYIFKRPKQ